MGPDNYYIVVQSHPVASRPAADRFAADRFAEAVNKLMADGWEPCGGISVVPMSPGETAIVMMQAMTRTNRWLNKPMLPSVTG